MLFFGNEMIIDAGFYIASLFTINKPTNVCRSPFDSVVMPFSIKFEAADILLMVSCVLWNNVGAEGVIGNAWHKFYINLVPSWIPFWHWSFPESEEWGDSAQLVLWLYASFKFAVQESLWSFDMSTFIWSCLCSAEEYHGERSLS